MNEPIFTFIRLRMAATISVLAFIGFQSLFSTPEHGRSDQMKDSAAVASLIAVIETDRQQKPPILKIVEPTTGQVLSSSGR